MLPPGMELLAGLLAGGVVALLAQALPTLQLQGGPAAWLAGLKGGSHALRFQRVLLLGLTTALLYLLMSGSADPHAPGLQITRLAWVPLFVLIAVIDIEHRRVLPVVLLPALLFATLEALTAGRLAVALAGGVAGTLLGGGMALGGRLYQRALYHRRNILLRETAFGGGDVLLAGLCGTLAGWPLVAPALLFAVFSAGAVAALLLAAGRVSTRSALPYAPFLLGGTLLALRFPAASAQLLRSFG